MCSLSGRFLKDRLHHEVWLNDVLFVCTLETLKNFRKGTICVHSIVNLLLIYGRGRNKTSGSNTAAEKSGHVLNGAYKTVYGAVNFLIQLVCCC